MASVEDCERAIRDAVERLAAVDPDVRSRYAVERTVAVRVADLDVVFIGRLDEQGLQDVRTAVDTDEQAAAQLRLATSSDDLVALLGGRLAVPAAWATGRLRIEASVLDLLKLRSLL